MASTIFETSNALTKKAWETKLFREVKKATFFSDYMGEGPDNIVQVKTNLQKDQGDLITFGLRLQMTGTGVTGDDHLEGKEEALRTFDDSVSLQQYRHGHRVKGRLSRKRAMFSIEEEAKVAIKDWGVTKQDDLCVEALLSAPTRVAYPVGASPAFTTASGGSALATAVAALNQTQSVITPKFLTQLRTYVKTGGNGRFQRLLPVTVKGKSYYVVLVPEDVLNDLFNNAEMVGAHKDARERGIDNPLFQSADLIYNGLLIRGYEKMPVATNGGGGSVVYGRCAILGAQALVWAWGMKEEVVQETFDYKNEVGYAWGMIAGVKKPKFNSEDYGSVGFCVSCSNISNA